MSKFSDAWKLARNSGLWKFLWNGHYYNTRKKGESDAEWNNFLTSNTDLLRRYNNYMNGTNLSKNSAEVVLNDRLYDYNNQVQKPYNPGTVSNPNSDLSNLYIGAHAEGTDESGLPKWNTIQELTLVSPIELVSFSLSELKPNKYTRKDIRNWINTHFLDNNNPYLLSGAERRAIRMVANGTATDNDKAIYKLIKDTYRLKDNSQWFKNGGMINYFQQGGPVSLENPQEKIVALVLAASLGDKLAIQTILLIQQAAENGDKQATQIMQFIQQVMQQMQQQTQKAKYGAKLGYLASLKGMCPNGSHLEYFKAGGQICKKCVKDAKQQAEKKVKLKMACGGATKTVNLIKTELCGGKVKKKISKHLNGGWIDRKKGIWNWDSLDRMRRVLKALQTGNELEDEDYEYIKNNPELESYLINSYSASKYNTPDSIYRGSDGRMYLFEKTDENGKWYDTAPDSTNNYKGRISVPQASSTPKPTPKPKVSSNPTNSYQNLSRVERALLAKLHARRKLYFDLWTNYVKKVYPQLLGKFKKDMYNSGYTYNYNTGIYTDLTGNQYRLNLGKLQTLGNRKKLWENTKDIPGMFRMK